MGDNSQKLAQKTKQIVNNQVNSYKEKKQAEAVARQVATQRASSGQCPKCGSEKLQAIHSTTSKGFSDSNACGGCCLFGPLGLLCGLCGSGKKQEHSHRMCLNCGNKF